MHCPCCGDLLVDARSVSGMRGLRFCGLVCHDKWDLVFRGIDRRPLPTFRVRASMLTDLARAHIIDHDTFVSAMTKLLADPDSAG